MKLTIDTQHDTFEDIQKVLHILTGILEQKGINPSSPAVDSTPLMGMFDTPQQPDKAPNFGSFLNLVNKKEEKSIEEPKIEFY